MAKVTYTAQRGFKLIGDENGAWMADTKAETVVGTQEVTNGDFTTTDVSYWDIVNSAVTVAGDGKAAINYSGTFAAMLYNGNAMVNGYHYELTVKLSAYTSGSLTVYLNSLSAGAISSTVEKTFYVTADEDGRVQLSTSDFIGDIDYIYLRRAESDLSTSNKGLGVYGSITKSPVATGAELVAYSGFSATNYLEQPYNSNLDFGVSDFCYMGWIRDDNLISNTINAVLSRAYYSSGWIGPGILIQTYTITGKIRFRISDDGFLSYDEVESNTVIRESGLTHFVAMVRTSTSLLMYVDGVLEATNTISAATGSLSNSSATLILGNRSDYVMPLSAGELSLWRVLNYAPTAAQIKAIYNSEKGLFKKNSIFTQVGESYSFDLPIQSAEPSTNTVKTDNVSIGGQVETIIDRDDEQLDITTGLLHRTDPNETRITEFNEFMYGTRGSEPFTLDLYGSVAAEDDPETYIRIGQHSGPTPESNMHNWFRGSFKARKL